MSSTFLYVLFFFMQLCLAVNKFSKPRQVHVFIYIFICSIRLCPIDSTMRIRHYARSTSTILLTLQNPINLFLLGLLHVSGPAHRRPSLLLELHHVVRLGRKGFGKFERLSINKLNMKSKIISNASKV
jgi:hypothetical protein